MKRAMITAFGRPAEVVKVVEVEPPRPGPGEVRVAMAAAPINPADELLCTGRHLFRPSLPAPVGIEGAGTVAEAGPGVQGVAVGDRVALPFGGTWSEQLVMRAEDVVVLPREVDLRQASMLSVNPVTAAGLLEGVSAGEWVLQNAAASAVGKLVIRLAARRGIHTVNVVRRESQVEELRALGADVVLVGEEDLPARVAAAANKAPIRRALDAVAGESSGRLFACVAEGGSLVCYGLLSDDRVILPASGVVFRDVSVRGYTRLRSLRSMPRERLLALYAELAGLLQAGHIETAIEASYPLERVSEALQHAERQGRSGKILITLG